MRYALLSDVHGNLEALSAALVDINNDARVDELIFLGDAVGYGANPNEVLQIVKSECKIRIMGNHDFSALGLLDSSEFNDFARTAINFTSSVLSDESKGILAAMKMIHTDERMTLVHSTPEAPEKWRYCLTVEDADSQFEFVDTEVCFIGHSHQPTVYMQNPARETFRMTPADIAFEKNHKYIVNVGSVGQPRDGDPRACYTIYDSIAQKIFYRRVDYDIKKAQSKMQSANLPPFLIDRLAAGR